MMMLTAANKKALPPLRSTDGVPAEEKDVIVKFFCPWGAATWYVVEGEQREDGDWEFYGWVDMGYGGEYGYFLLSQLTEIHGPFGMKIERDRNFEAKLGQVIS